MDKLTLLIVAGLLTFLGLWSYAFYRIGLLKGLAIGWLPAGIGGFIVMLLMAILLQ